MQSVKNMSLLPLDTDLDLLIKKHLDFKPLFPITVKMMAVNTKKVQKPKVWTISLKLGKSTNHDQNLYRSDGGQDTSACQSADHSFKCLQTLNVARFIKWKLNQKLGKYTDLDKNLLHSEENQDISMNCMLFLPCAIWKKIPENSPEGQTTDVHTLTNTMSPSGGNKKKLHLCTLASEVFITNWLNTCYFMGYLIFFYLFLLTTLQCLNKLSISLHCKHWKTIANNWHKKHPKYVIWYQIIDVKLTTTFDMSCHTTLHKSMSYTKLNYETTNWIQTVKYIFPFMIQWRPF